jgi:type II secretory pathway pseudopilin PulG
MRHPRIRLVPRQGFTLVELLVAVLLIDVGLLALVASGALVVRQAAEGRAHSAAVRIALNRLESLVATVPCAAASGGAQHPQAIDERWVVRLLPTDDREVIDSVRFPRTSGARTIVLRTRAPC